MKKIFTLSLVLFAIGCSSTSSPTKTLNLFGYVGATSGDALTKTSIYTNFVYFGTSDIDANFAVTMDNLQTFHQTAILNIAPVFWDFSTTPPILFSNWQTKFTSWIALNVNKFTPLRVYAVTPFDEPSGWGINMANYDAVCAFIKSTLPWIKIFHVDGISPASFANIKNYVTNSGSLSFVDIIAIDDYEIHPATDANFLNIRNFYKQSFPGKKWIYVLDGFWDANHITAFGNSINIMGTIASEWYSFALSDSNAIGLGIFIWDGGDSTWTQSKNFPASVLNIHHLIGNQV